MSQSLQPPGLQDTSPAPTPPPHPPLSPSLLKFISIESVMLSNHLILCCPFLLLPSNLSQHESLFQWVGSLHQSGGWSIRASASTSIFPMNIQDWFPLGLTGLISLQSKGLSRVFSNTTAQKHQFFGAQLSLCSIHDYWKNHSFD